MPSKAVSSDLRERAGIGRFRTPALPVTHNLDIWYLLSLLLAALTAVAGLAGLLATDAFYPTADLRQAALANDVMTLLLGLPILLGSMWLARRGRLIGLLFWPGAIFYGLYNYLTYLFGMPLTAMYPVYLVIVTLSIFTLVGVVAAVDGAAVRERVNGRLPTRVDGGVLIGFGFLFMLRSLGEMGIALAEQTSLSRPELGLLVADFLLAATLLAGGALLWRKRPLGYVSGIGLLFQASMLFVGLLGIMFLQPVLGGSAYPPGDFLAVLAMGFICFIPFALFVRGIVKS
jgi:hypothetical protein